MTPGAVLPEGWPRPSGYSNGVMASGRTLTIAGQIGWNPVTGRMESDDFAAQVRRALENVLAVVRAGGGEPSTVTHLTWFITSRDSYLTARPALGRTWRELFGAHYPSMSVVVVAGLLEPRALVEIEGVAMVG
jgi:enamine deaminase RidA (YjgF/YER057c/UK114 family)